MDLYEELHREGCQFARASKSNLRQSLQWNVFLRNGLTVMDDDALDLLSGSEQRDWFFAELAAPLPDDVIADLAQNEETN